MKLLSLFSGSGGFELAACLCGITPVAASEVEPYPIAVTKSRFPGMKHLGDVSKIKGGEIEPVDIITSGSPCTNLSVAGNREGLKGKQSSLFYEAIRIIREMRDATNGIYPRFAIWENVPGAFSSNKGEDFRTVLESFIRIVEENAVMPKVPKAGWAYADCIRGNGWSLAYRTLNAQYWGVPQRRRRIYLVADFGSECAGKILFEREGLRGNLAAGPAARQAAPADAERGAGADDRAGKIAPMPRVLEMTHADEVIRESKGNICPTLQARMGTGGKMKQQTFIAAGVDMYNQRLTGEKSATLRVEGELPCVIGVDCYHYELTNEKSSTLLSSRNDKEHIPCVIEQSPVYCLQGNGIDRADTAGCNGRGWREDASYTLNTIDRPAVAYAMQAFGEYEDGGKSSTLKERDYKGATDLVVENLETYDVRFTSDGTKNARGHCCKTDISRCLDTADPNPDSNHGGIAVVAEAPVVLDRAYFNQGENAKFGPKIYADGTCPTLVARGPAAVQTRYIVRRLTPTECARLQGFPDRHGDIDYKEDFTDEELEFWLEVRNTHAGINGKQTRQYSKQNMLAWYNGLHTDSAEYKMYGNGVALPCVLFVMRGILEAMKK